MHGNFLFPLIIFVIVVISKLKAAAQQPPPGRSATPPRPRAPRPPGESEEERYRRFMEAVGLPQGSAPPPPVRTRTLPTPGPLLPVQPPNLIKGVPDLQGRLKRVPAPPAPLAPRPKTVLRRVPAGPAPATASAAATEPAKTYFEAITPVAQPASLPPSPLGAPLPIASKADPIPSYPASALLQRLRDPASVREAMILREVLGPPKAFQLG